MNNRPTTMSNVVVTEAMAEIIILALDVLKLHVDFFDILEDTEEMPSTTAELMANINVELNDLWADDDIDSQKLGYVDAVCDMFKDQLNN
jgi:hypothetical protein